MLTSSSRAAAVALFLVVSMWAQGPLSVRVRDLGGSAAPSGACESGARYTQTGVVPVIWTCGTGLFWIKGVAENHSPVDDRPLRVVPAGVNVGSTELSASPDGLGIQANVAIGTPVNLWRATEDISASGYGAINGTIDGATSVNWNGITLRKFTSSNFFGAINTNMQGSGFNIFSTGSCYLQSAFVQNLKPGEQYVYLRDMGSSSFRHGRKLVTNDVRRIWALYRATSSFLIDHVATPTVAYGTASGNNPYWIAVGSTGGDNSVDLRIGGIQVELVPCEKQGIAMIGDSTTAFDSGNNDGSQTAPSSVAAGLLNVPTYNRAVGGDTCLSMDNRWATDMTPLAVNASHAIIQCGINDSNRTLAEIQANISSMAAKATADGMIPVIATVQPWLGSCISPTVETLRGQINSWIKSTFLRVLDYSAVLADPVMPQCLRRDPGWIGDQIHFDVAARRALGEYIANSYVGNPFGNPQIWNFRRPSPYQPVLASTPSRGRLLVGQPIAQTVGATLASAATIAPTAGITSVSGTTTINTITLPYAGFTGCLKLIPTGAWSTGTSGNIQIASTAVVSRALEMCFDGSKWYPSY